MRLATVKVRGSEKIAVVDHADRVFLLDEAARRGGFAGDLPRSVLEIVEMPDDAWSRLKVAAQVGVSTGEPVQPEAWLPPLRKPGKVIGIAINNGAIAVDAFKYFDNPAFFMKPPSALIGHQQPIKIRREYGLTHPEPEVAVIIGSRLAGAAEDEILDAVFGYTIINDVTSVGLKDQDSIHFEFKRDGANIPWRRAKSADDADIYLTYHLRSKGADTFGPIGPWIVTADEIADPNTLSINAWLGQKMIAEDSTANLRFPLQRAVSHLSRYVTLEPGDIVHLGTAVDPKRQALREQDFQKWPEPVRIEVEGIGTLLNPVEVVG